jgi:hypothetical protein
MPLGRKEVGFYKIVKLLSKIMKLILEFGMSYL